MQNNTIEVKLINSPTLKYVDWAIGECHDKGCINDEQKMLERIDRVANQHRHTSVLEFCEYLFHARALSHDELNSYIVKFLIDPHISIKIQSETEILVALNARVLKEKNLPEIFYENLPEEHKFLYEER